MRRHINVVTILTGYVRSWWLVRRAEGEMLLDRHPSEYPMGELLKRARAARQLLRDAGWNDARIDPWMKERKPKWR